MDNNSYKQVCFNELTLNPSCHDETEAYQRVSSFAQTLRIAQDLLGTRVVRYATDLSSIPLTDKVSLFDFCSKHKYDPRIIAILSSHTMPQVDPENEQIVDSFENTSAFVKKDDKLLYSSGLTSSFVYNTCAIGFNSEPFWNDSIHSLQISSGKSDIEVDWPCLTLPNHIECENFKRWKQDHSELSLIESTLSFKEKNVALRDDHGKDLLLEHATNLCRNEYVEGILCSLPFKPKASNYIYKIYPEGLIDIVLFWDDRGLSMRIKTTGRNIQETSAIAKLLEKIYSK